MFLRYGSYSHAVSEAAIQISRRPRYNEGGQSNGYTETWRIDGFLQAANVSALTVAIAAMKLGYSVRFRDLALLNDDGTPTAHYLSNALCVGGVRVVDGPNFPESAGAEYTTYRHYNITVEGTLLQQDLIYLAFHESLSFEGGGPRDVFLTPLDGLPVKQRVASATTYRVSQDGSAIGQFGYPPIPAPIWPTAEHIDQRRITRDSPKRDGPVGAPYFTEFKVNWAYRFESPIPLLNTPTRFPT